MVLDCPPPGLQGVGPGIELLLRRLWGAQMIEDAGDVSYSGCWCLPRASKHQIVVPAAVKLRAKSANLLDQASANDAEVSERVA